MSNPSNNFSFDLDPYDRLAQMLDGGLFKLLPLPPSWANAVRARYAATDPTLPSAPTSDTPGFDKSPMFTGGGTITPGFRPLPMAPTGDTPGFDKSPAVLEALAAADPRPPGFYRSPPLLGLRAFLPGRDSNPMSAPQLQPTSLDVPGLHPNTGFPDASGLVPVGYPFVPPSMASTQTAPPAGDPSLVLAQANSTPMTEPGAMSRPIDAPSASTDPNDIFAKAGRRPQMSVPIVPQQPTANGRGIAPPVEPPSNSLELEQEFQNWPGRVVRLPDGSPVPNPYSPNGLLMSPFSDLNDVAAAGRRLHPELAHLVGIDPIAALIHTYDVLRGYLGHGGLFDYQRRAYPFGKDGFTQLRQFRDVANFNVGLVGQQAGLSLWTTLEMAGRYAARNSSNYKPGQPYGLDPQTRELIEQGYRIGESGAYEPKSRR